MPTRAVCPPHLFYFLPLAPSGLSRASEQQLILLIVKYPVYERSL